MPYTSSDIIHLKTLAYHSDWNNVLLAFELLKSNGWQDDLATTVYWLQQRFLKEKKITLVEEVTQLLQTNMPHLLSLGNLFALASLPIYQLFQQGILTAETPAVDYTELAVGIHQLPLDKIQKQAFLDFLVRFGTVEIQQYWLPFLLQRRHTGVTTLDLSDFKFRQVPSAVLQLEQVEELNLDNNALTTLPDDWSALTQLESLHLSENKLRTLPNSFAQLQQLQRLYIQDNPWEIEALTALLKQLPALSYLSVGNNASKELLQLEALIQHELLNATEQEKRLFLALEWKDQEALEQLTAIELLEGLQHEQANVRTLARTQLLAKNPTSPPALTKEHASIVVLGLVSFATRSHLEQLTKRGWSIESEITKHTTHLLVGDHPEHYEAIKERTFVFISEQEINDLA
ncbi:MAG: leucine-rich repeat domain-containing protein [Aureispira sp.]